MLDLRHLLRTHGVIAVTDDAPVDVAAHWTAPAPIWGYLRGEDEIDPQVALLGGIVAPPHQALRSPVHSFVPRNGSTPES